MSDTTSAGRELSWRGVILGALITLVFTASNIYLGLKIGLTFASSIPATVISMTVLRALGGATILENNMVQTQASAAGTLSCVFAAVPALLMVGYWSSFPYWQTMLISCAGGMTGVLFTIPLRRALVTQSDLPYPEGVACAEILHASSPEGDRESVRALATGGIVAAIFTFLSGGLRLFSDGVGATLTAGSAIFRIHGGYSLALLATGYLVGIGGGIAMLLGVLIGWGVAVPWLTVTNGNPEHLAPAALATGLWLHKVRFLGAGTIAVAAVWTLLALMRPVMCGLSEALSVRTRALGNDLDRDLPPTIILGLGAILVIVLGILFTSFLWPAVPHGAGLMAAVALGLVACVALGFLVAAACGYMAGIVGSSSSPISGISIIAVVLLSLAILGMESLNLLPAAFSADQQKTAIAFALFVLTALTASAAISNDNLQDLKTGQMVGASPWRQEVGLLIGCVVGAVVIPPVLNVLYQAYGFVGSMPHPGMDPARALAAPQPALMAALAQGILLHRLDWEMILIGAGLGVALILLDQLLRLRRLALPPLAVGMGIYLPSDVSVTIGIGAVLSYLVLRTVRNPKGENSTGTMIASGFIVGESLTGVVLAAVSGATGGSDALALPVPESWATAIGGAGFVAVAAWFAYRIRAAAN
ncbi:oligopeptide transporter membrane spanning protein [Neoasaia chiangmaiensis NBRC 101099]|uniref:Oligopeptide transporter, OPT family n=1 Tax=Neoasaia chiangmaiensis TaxID=320497 RepID=A0A1U9KPE0_9PROT|nr:oligopeptide transporter, OPT family [Neoasaia chiangmaiensis]AQS87672.1 oligopeptide transporter, OPT family [Neoasaia chiangmaiensis]GBR41894.1 oligopeptide transporter membrane spanning protein [Neoasaia chiangmaiensis NBRC 101099]GEN14256.1 oligopeptide transporter, OPT family protein [Neoasaia chiangmaiensis]